MPYIIIAFCQVTFTTTVKIDSMTYNGSTNICHCHVTTLYGLKFVVTSVAYLVDDVRIEAVCLFPMATILQVLSFLCDLRRILYTLSYTQDATHHAILQLRVNMVVMATTN